MDRSGGAAGNERRLGDMDQTIFLSMYQQSEREREREREETGKQ
jgi:hypothetical protein